MFADPNRHLVETALVEPTRSPCAGALVVEPPQAMGSIGIFAERRAWRVHPDKAEHGRSPSRAFAKTIRGVCKELAQSLPRTFQEPAMIGKLWCLEACATKVVWSTTSCAEVKLHQCTLHSLPRHVPNPQSAPKNRIGFGLMQHLGPNPRTARPNRSNLVANSPSPAGTVTKVNPTGALSRDSHTPTDP